MDIVTSTKSQLRASQWAKAISDCQASGLTITRFCEANNLNVNAYYYWLRKLRLRTIDNLPVPVKQELVKTEPTEPVKFKKLEVISPVPDTVPAVVIRLPYATLELTNSASQQTMEAVLLALKSTC